MTQGELDLDSDGIVPYTNSMQDQTHGLQRRHMNRNEAQ